MDIHWENWYSSGDHLFSNPRKCLIYGGPCRDRTCNHLIKSQMLQPTERLLLQCYCNFSIPNFWKFTTSFTVTTGVFTAYLGYSVEQRW